MYYVYIFQSLKDKRTYIGYTRDLDARLIKHNSGQVASTKHRRPLKLLFFEEFLTMKEAKERELWFKTSSGRKKLKEIFEVIKKSF